MKDSDQIKKRFWGKPYEMYEKFEMCIDIKMQPSI